MNIPQSSNYNREIIINGRRMRYQGGSVRGSDLIRAADPGRGRRAVIRAGGMQFEKISPSRVYAEQELLDKHGNPVEIKTIPDRTKGMNFFSGRRSELSRQLIRAQVYDIAAHCFREVDFDEEGCNWFIVPKYRLPAIWQGRVSPLLIVFPTVYPEIPPIGFYLKEDLGISPNGHLLDNALHGAYKAPLQYGWKWYCCYVNPGAWRPARLRVLDDWRKGDNLWTYMTLVNEVLAGIE